MQPLKARSDQITTLLAWVPSQYIYIHIFYIHSNFDKLVFLKFIKQKAQSHELADLLPVTIFSSDHNYIVYKISYSTRC